MTLSAARDAQAQTVKPVSGDLPVFFVTNRQIEQDKTKRIFSKKRHFRSGCEYGMARVLLDWTPESPDIVGPLWHIGWRPSPKKVGETKKGMPPPAVLQTTSLISDKVRFFEEVKQAIEVSPTKQVILFVHGYNNGFDGAVETAAELEFAFRSPVIAFSWPSQHEILKYTVDECNIEWSLRDFRLLLRDLDEKIGAENVIVVGHSMGNRLLLSSLIARADKASASDENAEPKHFKAIVLSSPDVDSGTMKNWSWLVQRNADAKWLFVSHKDIPLRLSRGVHGNKRLGGTGKIIFTNDVDLAWAHPEVPFGFKTLDFTDVDYSKIGHAIPYPHIAQAAMSGAPLEGFSWIPRKENKSFWSEIKKVGSR